MDSAAAGPDRAVGGTAEDRRRVAVACRVLDDTGGPVPAVELARVAACSTRQLHRAFAAVLGVGALQYGRAVRTGRAREVLRGARGSVTDAVWEAGYGSARGFYEEVGRRLGMSPAEYARGGPGRRLQWSWTATAVGAVLVVVSPDGICAVRVAADGEADVPRLLDEVAAELPHAELVRDDAALVHVLDAVRELADGRPLGPAARAGLPLDVAGTAFQARVWEALQEIPAGETRTYTEVAAAVGRPTSVRAVARACATNPVALVVPCHRVVRADGSLAGYRWGLAVKRSLLDAERRSVDAGDRTLAG